MPWTLGQYTIALCERITELRIRISPYVDENKKLRRFKTPDLAQRFLSIHAATYNSFYHPRHPSNGHFTNGFGPNRSTCGSAQASPHDFGRK